MGGWLPDGIAEWPVNVWCWGLFAFIYATTDRKERIEMVAVVALATPMELSSGLRLVYEYQRDFMPLFALLATISCLIWAGMLPTSCVSSGSCRCCFPCPSRHLWGLDGGDTSGVFMLLLVLGFAMGT